MSTPRPSSLFGTVVLTGWIGEHPADGGDFSMLMAYSPNDGDLGATAGLAARRELVAGWGMKVGGFVENPVIQGTPVTATLEGITVTVTGFPGLDLVRPTSREWAEIALQRGQIFLAFATRAAPPNLSDNRLMQFVQDDETIQSTVSMLIPVH
ncbi:DUF5949 family protein [Streptomyces sp. NPDC056465]|uniref:DUF5949 family protein n=1 Tax=unclassified Streptomyces TaxID=2593676 RepID=UPI0035DA6653